MTPTSAARRCDPPPEPVPVAREMLTRVLGRFEPVGLEQLGAAALMARVDRKFVLPAHLLPDLLERCAGRYRTLEVAGRRLCRYRTLYFDTPDLALYHAHHAGRLPRYKIRLRTYVDAAHHYLEVKRTANTHRTVKSRLRLCDGGARMPERLALERLALEPLLDVDDAVRIADLRAAVTVTYTRITLVDVQAAERVTLDLMLEFSRGARAVRLPGVVVAEVKQERHQPSPFIDAARRLGVREGAISKYCLGVATLCDSAKRNRFVPFLLRLHQMSDVHVHCPDAA